MTTKLIIQDGPAKGAIYELTEEPVTLGRDLTCEVQLPDSKVSRRHATIAPEGDRWTIADLGSRNGTLVNGQKVESQGLASRDEITVGDTTLLFVAEESAPTEMPPDDHSWVQPTVAETVVTERLKLLSRGQARQSREELESANEALITLFNYSRAASEARGLPELLRLLVRAAEEAVEPDRVVPIILEPRGAGWRLWVQKTSELERRLAEVPVSRSIVEFALREGLSVLSHAPAEDERFRESPSVQLNRIATAMCVPLRGGGELLGGIYADRIGEAEPFTRTDLELLTAFAMPTVVAMGNIRSAENLHRECQTLERQVRSGCRIIGQSKAIEAVREFIEKAAPLTSGVLLIGESGTGKELVARAIHYSGHRARGPLEAVNCAALTETLLESELFGHVKGAFTGAVADRAGRFELANNGTLFLDEVAELPPASQAKLLRVLESGEFRRVGDVRDRASNARLIVATNKELARLVEEGKFREDLYYRLNVLTCTLPPLRDHLEDLDLLCEHALAEFARACGKPPIELTRKARDVLQRYHWPGNVRELRNVVERLVALTDKTTIDAADLPPEVRAVPAPKLPPVASLQDLEREHIERVLRHTGGNKKEAARILGIDRSTLYAKLKTYRIKTE